MTTVVEFFVEECCNCGVLFGMTMELHEACYEAGATKRFYCPNGHRQWYTKKSDAELRKEADRKRAEAEAALTAERDQRLAAERELKRQEKRAKAGVCPCCNRSFVQLARHMKTKHPEFAVAK